MTSNIANDPSHYHTGAFVAYGYDTGETFRRAVLFSCSHIEGRNGVEELQEINERLKKSASMKRGAALKNAFYYLGAIPGVGVFTGGAKIVMALSVGNGKTPFHEDDRKGRRNALVIRGIAEACGVGVLCVAGDVYATRKKQQNPMTEQWIFDHAKPRVPAN